MTWEFQQFHPPGARGKFKDELMTSDGWVAEEKYDGDRRIAQFCQTDDGHPIVRFTGRVTSKKNGLLVEKSGNLPHLAGGNVDGHSWPAPPGSLVGTVLDGEIVCADPLARSRDVTSIMGSLPAEAIRKQQERGWLKYVAFDCLFYKGTDLRGLPWLARRTALVQAIREWGNPHAEEVAAYENKQQLLDSVWGRGGEGIILKRIDAKYDDEKSWVKVKREETHDVVVMGFDAAKAESKKVSGEVTPTKYAAEGLIGAIRFGQMRASVPVCAYCAKHTAVCIGAYEGGDEAPACGDCCGHGCEDGQCEPISPLAECGACSGFDDATRRDMTANPEKYLGRVMEITAQLREPSGAFRHPRFKRWRDDKSAEACVWGQT